MMIVRKGASFALKTTPNLLSTVTSFSSDIFSPFPENTENLHLSPHFRRFAAEPKPSNAFNIELVDDELWRLSSYLSKAWHEDKSSPPEKRDDEDDNITPRDDGEKETHDLDEIEAMRIHGSLYYKIERGSKEYEDLVYNFHGSIKTKNSKNKNKNKKYANRIAEQQREEEEEKEEEEEIESTSTGSIVKVKRAPTFNQRTEAYHKPFCLDIFVSRASVRACVVHRATSKVVAVAHSISKDMKFDLDSLRNDRACQAVGSALAQRALADDIHDILYVPRKGDKIEGKLQIVLQSVIDAGINVEVKIKQWNPSKRSIFSRPLYQR